MTRLHLLFGFVAASLVSISAALVACSDDKPNGLSSSGHTTSSGGGTSSSGSSGTSSGTSGAAPVTYKAKATIAPTITEEDDAGDSKLSGTVEFAETDGTTKITISIKGGIPGDHGFHIHENASCADGGVAAGPHWNPLDAGHGFPDSPAHHFGDLGNVLVNSDGTGSTTKTTKDFTVQGGPNSVVNHAVIYHEKHDDGTGAAGNAGARPGCGIVTKE